MILTLNGTAQVAPSGAGSAATAEAERIEPFKIHVDDAVLNDLQQRLAQARLPDAIKGAGWEYGVDLDYMKALIAYWRDQYDWRAQERALNQFDQFTTTIDGLKIHFLHQRSKEKNALPLIIVHGWPGSFYEFHKIIGLLTDPVAHGGKAEDAFHVVCPSLPGFGFSGKPQEKGWSSQRMAEVMAKLMARLGYARYGAQGGDWGSGIARWLASGDGGHCIGGHSNFPGGSQPKEDPLRGVTEAEIARSQQRARELRDHYGYSSIQGSRPLTLGYALNDSPVGLASWVVDKLWAWSDHQGNLHVVAERQVAVAHHVDVRLGELAGAAFLRAFAAPHLLDLVAPEGERQVAGVFDDVAGERDSEVEVQG